ncbi:MAG: DsrE family protein [Desulfosalsimonadaceae bacterium]
MKTKSLITRCVFVAAIIFLFGMTNAMSGEYKAMQEVESADTVFDFRISDPSAALSHLGLIHNMKDDPNMEINGSRPDIILVFIGPSVKLISTDRSDFDQQEQKTLHRLAEKIASMDSDGIKFEICMTAAGAHNVDSDTILSEFKKVENGWISLVGYQNKGYAMIADF